ncbi:hypothetical protein HDU76_007886 [Blyttiomyces sp. JEL0837]|nr:hypothetical protein HDU76_007886 [Blyttiomyces sp. JEL0837]
MSRGGWRGGRGRGRGGFGGFGPDANIEANYQEIPLFPDVDLPHFRELTEKEEQVLAIDKKFMEELKESPFHLDVVVQKDDIERYSDKYKTGSKPSKNLLMHVPIAAKTAKGSLDLEKRLKQLEDDEKKTDQSKKGSGLVAMDDEEEEVRDVYDEENEEEADDYLNDFYADDDEGGDDSDGGGDY